MYICNNHSVDVIILLNMYIKNKDNVFAIFHITLCNHQNVQFCLICTHIYIRCTDQSKMCIYNSYHCQLMSHVIYSIINSTIQICTIIYVYLYILRREIMIYCLCKVKCIYKMNS